MCLSCVQVVCEELEWLPFYNDDVLSAKTDTEGREEVPKGEVISRVLNVCSYWMTSFTKYSSWLENPSNVKAAKFLSKGFVIIWSRQCVSISYLQIGICFCFSKKQIRICEY
jgi:hypothetical protein